MPKYFGCPSKISGRHTTLSELALKLVLAIIEDDMIKSVNFSYLQNSNSATRGRWRVKILDLQSSTNTFLVKTTQNNSFQELYITVEKDEYLQPVKLMIARFVRDQGWELRFK